MPSQPQRLYYAAIIAFGAGYILHKNFGANLTVYVVFSDCSLYSHCLHIVAEIRLHKGGGELTARCDSGCSFVVQFCSRSSRQQRSEQPAAEETVL